MFTIGSFNPKESVLEGNHKEMTASRILDDTDVDFSTQYFDVLFSNDLVSTTIHTSVHAVSCFQRIIDEI